MAKRSRRALVRALPQRVAKRAPRALNSVDDGRGWMTIFSGHPDPQHWQKHLHTHTRELLENSTVFACQTLIASDISKLSILLVEKLQGVWLETESPAYRTFFRKPNGFQTLQQFVEQWVLSKQTHGNTYVLLARDAATRVNRAYILNPDRVTPLVAPNGDVFYRLKADDLATVPDGEVVVPASEIIHDRFNCLFHPLVGLSPLWASALAASQGLTIQERSSRFFSNGSRPGGLLVSPQMIQPVMAEQYKQRWAQQFGSGGTSEGGIAVLGNGLKYEPIMQSAVDSDLVKQLGMTDEAVCRTHHVPPYKVGVGPTPTYQNAEVLNQIYYDSCLQVLIEAIEKLFDDGLELHDVNGRVLRAQFDLDGLLRMDNRTLIAAVAEGVKAGVMAPNEGRQRINLRPVDGGASPYLQQQNYSLEALAKRDALDDPFATMPAAAPVTPPPPTAANDDTAAEDEAAVKAGVDYFCRDLEYAHA